MPMKVNRAPSTAALCLLVASLCGSHAQTPFTNLQLRLEPRTNALDLVVAGDAAAGAFFIYQANTLESLLANPVVAVETNTPLTNGLRFSLPAPGGSPGQAFFTAAHWPGRTVEEFGEPENYPDIPPPAMVLFTSGAPAPLTSGQTFTVDFFIADPAGQLLDVSGPVAVLIFRESDGALHPDAKVSPPTGDLTNGHLRLEITLTAAPPLAGYALGLGPADASLLGKALKASSALNDFLRTAFNLGPAPLPTPTAEALLQTLEQRRTDNADAGPSWSYPLAGIGHPVSGTFGEWRGKDNNNVHRGVDLAAGAASTVVASRGGVVSHRGTIAGMGDYLVLDHGGGWFSRYLHLDSAHISVIVGQAVARGATLATWLYAVATWPQHLHFEIRRGANQSQWNVGLHSTAQDPLQTPSVFTVPPGATLPELREFGLTRQHLGQNPFVKGPPAADAPGPVYLFAKFLDPEPKPDGKERKLGLRAMRFQPE